MTGSTAGGVPPRHPIMAAVAAIDAELQAALSASAWSLTDAEVVEATSELQAMLARAEALRLAVVREADGRVVGKRVGATSTTAWLKGAAARMSPSTAHRTVKLAHALDTKLTATRDALAAGKLSVEHAQVIDRAIQALPRDLEPGILTIAETTLIDYAEHNNPDELRDLGRRILELVAPDDADERLRKKLSADERRAARQRELYLKPDPETPGGLLFRGKADADMAELLHAVCDQYAKPRPTDPETPDERSRSERQGEALHEVLKQFLDRPDAPKRHGNRVQVVLTMAFEKFASETGYGTYLRSQAPVSATKVREYACDADVAYVWAGTGAGTTTGDLYAASRKRTFDGKLRRLLEIRDGGCAFPSCDRPPSWCAAHHVKHWVDGGPTVLNNGILLCQHHHTLIHHGDWTVRIADDQLPEFIPPEYVDPRRNPIRNGRLRL